MTDGDIEAIIGVAGDAVFNSFGLTIRIGEQCQKGLGVVPRAKDKRQRKRLDFVVALQLRQQFAVFVGLVIVNTVIAAGVERNTVEDLGQISFGSEKER